MKAIFFIRLFDINFDFAIRQHFRMNNLRIVVKRQKWILHNYIIALIGGIFKRNALLLMEICTALLRAPLAIALI